MRSASLDCAGTCIVHAVGYDCIPWDLGTLLCAKFAKEKLGRRAFTRGLAGGATCRSQRERAQ